ncbi:hypothetical protein Tco_1450725, partial [Tanacetum coccineum]
MAREAEIKKQRVFNTGNGVAKPLWNNANRVNHANHFVPRPVQLNAVRPNSNSVRLNVNTSRANVNYGRANVNSVRQNVNSVRSNVNTDHLLKNMEDRGIFNSGCSSHMTGNKDHLDDFKECKGGSVTYGGSKGYITGKGRIRVGNLEFDSVSFVKELGHFNLFSISQICDKQHKVLFTETECIVVSPDFKMPDDNQILLKVPRQHNMYSFDMKTPAPTKDYACLIAKASSDESNKQHKASCKAKLERTITEPLHTLHMDLFGPTSGRNLQEEGLDEMVRSIMKDKSEDFETPTQGKTSGEADISLKGLEATETLAKVLTQRTKTNTRKVKTRLRRKLDADEVNTGEGINTGFTDANTAFEEIKSGDDEVNSGDESIIPSPKKGQREGKAVLEEKSQSKRTKKHIKEEQASLAKIVRLQAQEEAKNARKAEQQRQDALITKKMQDELELSKTQKNRMAQVQEAAKYYTKEDWDSEDVEAYMDERVDEPSSEEFQMGSIVKWQILKT